MLKYLSMLRIIIVYSLDRLSKIILQSPSNIYFLLHLTKIVNCKKFDDKYFCNLWIKIYSLCYKF